MNTNTNTNTNMDATVEEVVKEVQLAFNEKGDVEMEYTNEQLRKMMVEQMSVSWSQLNGFFNDFECRSDADTESAYELGWLRSKLDIFKRLGNKLRIEREVELSLSDSEVRNEIGSFISAVQDKIEHRDLGLLVLVCGALSTEDILENRLTKDIQVLSFKASKGMKISRVIGKIFSDAKQRDLVQTEFSKITQGFKATGTLVLSIDPIDLLAMSHNPDSSWRSCHNIVDGEYRAGASAYVTDQATMIAYTYRRTAPSYGGIEIPNKMWRQLVYLAPETAYLSTHYPSLNKNNRRTLTALLTETLGGEDTIVGFSDTEFLNISDTDRFHYNDLIEGRTNRSCVVDLTGRSAEFDSIEAWLSADSSDLPKDHNEATCTYVGVEDLDSVFGGEVYESEEV